MGTNQRQGQTYEEAIAETQIIEFNHKNHVDFLTSIITKQTEIQTLIFSKKHFTRESVVKWARDHDFHSGKVDETSTSFRLRQKEPGDFIQGSFRTIELTTGVKAVIGRPRPSKAKVGKDFWKNVI